jgi:hypothetical protein
MDEFGAVAEPEIQEVEQVEQEQPEVEQPQQDEEWSSWDKKYSKPFSDWLKSVRDSGDPNLAKLARYAKDNEGRLYNLHLTEPRGLDGIKETYAAVQGIQHGELKGIEALGAIQDQVRDYEQSDELLAAGDPKVLDLFGDDFNEGLGKLTPAILDRIQQSNPEAYSAAILPHLVQALRTSPIVQDFNGIVDVLNDPMPQWMAADTKYMNADQKQFINEQRQAWVNEKFEKITNRASGMATWLNAQDQAVKGKGPLPQNGNRQQQPDRLSQEREALDNEKRQMYWDKNIHPETKSFGDNRFQELMKPYAGRLKLDAPAMEGLKKAFLTGVVQKLAADRTYTSQLSRYQKQMNPDAKTVVNLANVNFDKHAKSVLEGLIDERGYRKFMGQRPMNTPNGNGAKPAQAPQSGVTIVSVKPAFGDIDHKNTPIEWLRMHKYRMTNGRVVQVKN